MIFLSVKMLMCQRVKKICGNLQNCLRYLKHVEECYYVTSSFPSLTTAFNVNPKTKNYEFFRKSSGLLDIQELTSPHSFHSLKEDLVKKVDSILIQISEESHDAKKRIEIFDELSDSLCQVADLAEFVRLAHPNKHYSNVADEVCTFVNCMVEKLNTHQKLYYYLKNCSTNGEQNLSEVDKYVRELFLFDFEQSGIHLPQTTRKNIVNCNENILLLGQKFMHGAFQHRTIVKSQLPDEFKNKFPSNGINVFVDGLHGDCADEEIREAAYKLYLAYDEIQDYYLCRLLEERNQLAKLCGFDTFASRVLKGTLARNPDFVKEFLDQLALCIHSSVLQDFQQMKVLKQQHGSLNKEVCMWDTTFLTHVAKNMYFQQNVHALAAYFSLGMCMQGLNNLVNKLYGIQMHLEDTKPGEIVSDENELLGYIYCDFYEREGKPSQDCHFTIRGGRLLSDGTYQLPVVVVMLNLHPPTGTYPCLLHSASIDNLFHEMGHALHSLMARPPYQHVSGTRCSTDLAEVPSTLMEKFSSDPREPLSWPELVKMCAAKHLFAASEMQLQKYHGPHPLHKSTTEILKDLQDNYYALPHVPQTAWQLRFSHLVGYGAKYYSYLVSRALSAAIWQKCFQELTQKLLDLQTFLE